MADSQPIVADEEKPEEWRSIPFAPRFSVSNPGDVVLDPFSGSGTTTKMARLMGRRFIGIDVNEEYCEIARKRLQQKLLDFGDAG